MCIFGYLKTPDIILSLVSSRKLDWTHTFDTIHSICPYSQCSVTTIYQSYDISIGNYTVREVLMKNRTRVWRNVYNTASA